MDALRTWASIGRLHIVAIAALGTFTFAWLFLDRYLFSLAAISALDWFLVNLLNRVVDLKEDKLNAIRGVQLVDRRQKGILYSGLFMLLSSLVLFAFFFPIELTIFRLLYHLLGLSYNWSFSSQRPRLKERYFWKNTASAMGFLLTVFGYPLAIGGFFRGTLVFPPGMGSGSLVFLLLFFFLFEISYEIMYDLRDIEGDRLAKVKTYPVVHGEKTAMRIIDALLLTSSLILLLGYLSGHVPWRAFVMILAPLVNFFFYKRAMKRGLSKRDCIQLTYLGAALLFLYHLWVVLGLPGVT